jgi:hypothetical protein
MNRRHWIDQRRDAAIDAVLGHLAPATAGLTLGWVATARSEPAIWLPGFALVALGVAQCIVRIRVRTCCFHAGGCRINHPRIRCVDL